MEKNPLYKQQLEAVAKIIDNNGGIVWMKVGQGKTRVGLYGATGIAKLPVILCVCRRAAFYDWTNEVATLQLNLAVKEIEEFKHRQPIERPTLMLVSEGKLNNDNIIDLMNWFLRNELCDTLILDEGWLFKNTKAEKHKAILPFSCRLKTILLSGSIMSRRDLVEIYGQIAAAGRGRQLAKNLTAFRTEFQLGIGGKFGNYMAWYPKPGSYQAIIDRIEAFTYIYFPRITNCKIHESIKKIPMTYEQKDFIRQLKHYAEIESEKVNIELNSMATVVIKAQQISDGWIRLPNGTVEYLDSNKLDVCQSLVQDIIKSGERVVVWCAFKEDIVRLIPYMSALQVPVVTLQSGEDFDLKLWQSNQVVVALATEASGSSVNHFAQVPYGIYFSQDWKWRSLEQSQGRHTRRSSRHDTAYFYFLHCEHSLDSQVYYTVRTSQSSEGAFVKKLDALQWVKAGKTWEEK